MSQPTSGNDTSSILQHRMAKAISGHPEELYEPDGSFDNELVTAIALVIIEGKKSEAIRAYQRLGEKFRKDGFLVSGLQEQVKEKVLSLKKAAAFTAAPLAADEVDLLKFGLNDQGNADRIKEVYGEDLRFCPNFKKWLVWDGMRWIIDEVGKSRQLAKDVMRTFIRQAAARDEELFKTATTYLNDRQISAMLRMLESDLPIGALDLDLDPWALNCLNGTVDLRTSELTPHRRRDFITKLVHFDYRKESTCKTWDTFLYSAMGGSESASAQQTERAAVLVSYIQRALGYSITGSTSEKAVFIPLGEHGNNGKSTMLDTVRRIIREYSALLQVDTLMVRQESNNTQADLADLRGARFVQTSETEESQSLSQGKLKLLTAGMGTIKACRKFENPVEFEANFHIWLDTNKMPHIKDPDDTATLARLHPIPFRISIASDKIDRTMPDKLFAEAEGILAWMIAGAKEWFESKLDKPEEVDTARDEWKSSQNDPWEESIESWIEKHNNDYPGTTSAPHYTVSIPAIMEGALSFKIKDMGTHRGESIRIGRILKRAGWIIDRQTGNAKIRVYRKKPPEDVMPHQCEPAEA